MKILKVLAVGVAVVGVGVASTLTINAAEWKARTVDQIKADIAKTNGKEYIITWGDTLSGISQATNMTVDALAQLNSIANVDLIFAGNKLIFDGDVMTVQNDQGETVAQTVVTPERKVDPNKKLGEAVDSTDKTSGNTATTPSNNNGGTTTSSTAGGNTSSSSNTTDSTSNGGNSNTGNTGGSTGNTGGSNTGDSSNTGNSSSNTGESNTGGSSSNTGDSSTGGSNGGTGETTEPSTPEEPEEPTIVSGYIGNSGKVFNTALEANTWANEILASDFSKNGYYTVQVFYSDGSKKFSIDWY